jgi:hypothetical protein
VPVENSLDELIRETKAKYNPISSANTISGSRKGEPSTRRRFISMKFNELMSKNEQTIKEMDIVRKKPNLQNLLLVSRCWMILMA